MLRMTNYVGTRRWASLLSEQLNLRAFWYDLYHASKLLVLSPNERYNPYNNEFYTVINDHRDPSTIIYTSAICDLQDEPCGEAAASRRVLPPAHLRPGADRVRSRTCRQLRPRRQARKDCNQRDGENKERSHLRGYCHYPHREEEYRLPSSLSIKCIVLWSVKIFLAQH